MKVFCAVAVPEGAAAACDDDVRVAGAEEFACAAEGWAVRAGWGRWWRPMPAMLLIVMMGAPARGPI